MKPTAPDADYLDRLITERDAADFLGYTMRALQNWRTRGGGPLYVKVSPRSIRYRRRDLNAWVESKLAKHSTEASIGGGHDV
ncbi:helix-turn-helix transcriptional regulator [Thioclava electrotropha]|uniref:Helix-turn-helix domain-containing protein n=1 Tax=Thioclava electrotropha TaxID=1549850 RepID=A0ABX6YPG5_9RHOB|nr:helix-turn-helix domain-containing protein [Thioclava electrotropha]QPZ89690.1 helix-turn-helix domain-containing protein [Thioclava electrotropha]